MTEFTSTVQQIPYSTEKVFTLLSDLNNLKSIKENLHGKVKDFEFNRDGCTLNVDPVGKIIIQITEREINKHIKFESKESPVEFTGWIQLVEAAPNDTRLKLTLRADLPFFLKAMVSPKLKEGIEKAAQALAGITY